VRHVPLSIDTQNLALQDGKAMGSRQVTQGPKVSLRERWIKLLD
jgi:hypothetical protein